MTVKTKPAWNAKLKHVLTKRISGRCSEFPCPLMKKHSKKYIKRHDLDTLSSAKRIKTTGIGKMMAQDRERWLCPECGGVVKFQNNTCSLKPIKLKVWLIKMIVIGKSNYLIVARFNLNKDLKKIIKK